MKVKEPQAGLHIGKVPERLKHKLQRLANRDTNGVLKEKLIQLVEEAK